MGLGKKTIDDENYAGKRVLVRCDFNVPMKDGVITNLNDAKYPALTTGSGTNNFQTSDFWLYSTDQFNLAKVQFTYDFAEHLFENSKVVKGVSVYLSGTDLLKIARNREILEMNVGSAPQSRFYNLGVKVQF